MNKKPEVGNYNVTKLSCLVTHAKHRMLHLGQCSAHGRQGFTLIELLVALIIVAVLSAFAVSSYTSYSRKADRADAAATLQEAALYMQRFQALNNNYAQDLANNAVALPAPLSQSPRVGLARYIISIDSVDAQSYRLIATPVNSQANDACGILSFNESAVQGASGAANAQTVAACWR